MTQFALDADDRPIGRILKRREVLSLLGGSVLLAACAPTAGVASSPAAAATAPGPTATFAAAATGVTAVVLPSCVVRPALTEGPYFVDEKLERSDIRSEPSTNAVKPGVPLGLTFLVSRVGGSSCTTLAGATVDVWQCDALGVYSDVTDRTKFLRGYQTTDVNGNATFATVWPGWYPGRAVHIHFKIRTAAAGARIADFTSQRFFDEALNIRSWPRPRTRKRPRPAGCATAVTGSSSRAVASSRSRPPGAATGTRRRSTSGSRPRA